MIEAIISGLLLGLALVFSVGPALFTVIKLRISYGLSSAFYFVAGVWLSDLLWVTTANLFGTLLENIVVYKLQIGSAGGLFLISLGVYYLFFKKYHSKEEMDQGVKITSTTHARLFFTGFLLNTLNPGVIALWLAAAANSAGRPWKYIIVTFSICLAMTIAADFLKINLAGKLRRKLNDKNITIINKISGFLFIAFGVALILGVVYTGLKK